MKIMSESHLLPICDYKHSSSLGCEGVVVQFHKASDFKVRPVQTIDVQASTSTKVTKIEGSRVGRNSAWFPASTRPRSFEGTGRQGSDLLTPRKKPAKLLKLLNPYLENRVQSFFCVNERTLPSVSFTKERLYAGKI